MCLTHAGRKSLAGVGAPHSLILVAGGEPA